MHSHNADLSIDAMDVSGDHQLDILHSVFKKRLSMDGKLIPEQKEEQYHIGAEAKLNGTANTTTTEVATESTENKCGRCVWTGHEGGAGHEATLKGALLAL